MFDEKDYSTALMAALDTPPPHTVESTRCVLEELRLRFSKESSSEEEAKQRLRAHVDPRVDPGSSKEHPLIK